MKAMRLFRCAAIAACLLCCPSTPGLGQETATPASAREFVAGQMAEQQHAIRGSICGIGAGLKEGNGGILVTKIMPGTPAERAGLPAGSEITAINGISTEGMKLSDAVKLVRGPVGTTVSLDIRTAAGTASHLDIVRKKVVLGRPRWSMCRPTIGLLKLSSFNGETATEVKRAIVQLEGRGAKALIIDLKGCGGGDLRAMKDVTSLFLRRGAPLWLIEDIRSGERKLIRTSVQGHFAELPLAVLVDKNTHGELPAAAIKQNRRGRILGQTTSGMSSLKSLVTNVDGSLHSQPVGNLLMGPRQPITGVGVAPDIELPERMTEEECINAAVQQLQPGAKPAS